MAFRILIDRVSNTWMIICLILFVILPLAIGLGLIIKAGPILQSQPFWSLMTGTDWSPMQNKFGFLPFITGTLWVTILSFILSAPVCLLSAVYLTQYAKKWFLSIMHPVIDILAGLPSVVYGVWGILVLIPFVKNVVAPLFGVQTSGYCILSGAMILAIMILPYMLNMLIEVFSNIPVELKEASLSLGATYWETIKKVVLKKGFIGIISAFGLGIAKALGETIAVLMVIGNIPVIPKGLFDPAYPLPSLIANNYGEMMSIPNYDSALMLAALILFVIVLLFNMLSRYVICKYEIL